MERARLEAVLRHLPAGVIIAEAPSGRLILGNDQVEKIWRQPFVASAGIDQQAAYRGFYSDGRPYHPEDWPLARSIAHGEAVVDEEMEFLRGDGSRGAMLMSSSPIHDEQGRIVAGVAIFHNVTERKQAERDLQAALKEKEVLLREIHHRVKNNLQIMSSLLSLEQKHIEDPVARSKFRETQSRIKTMSLLHDALYRSQDLSQVDLAQYIGRITNTLFAAYDASRNGIALHIGIPEAFTNLDTAIPCGLIVNELVSNALKYAFPDGRKGEVSVGLEVNADGRFILRVSDNGAGSPADLDFRNTKSLGLQLVAALADQLEASIDLRRQGGTTFEIAFREQEYRRRY